MECSFQRASSWAKSAVYRSTTSSMFAGGLPITDLATSGWIGGALASLGPASLR